MSVLSSNYYMVLYPNTFAASWTDHVAGRINNDVRPWAMVIGLATAALSGGKTTRQCLHMRMYELWPNKDGESPWRNDTLWSARDSPEK